MWKLINGKLHQTVDTTRVKFRTNISKTLLEQLEKMACENQTYVNYLIENGLLNVIQEDVITFDKNNRPKDRIQFKTTYDAELLQALKDFAKRHKLFMNDVIEYSTNRIDVKGVKDVNYRYRIEKVE